MAVYSIRIEGEDDASKMLDHLSKKLKDVSNQPGDFVPSFDVSNLPGALRQITTLQGTIGALSGLGFAGGIAAVGLEVGQTAVELGKMGAEVQRTADSYDRLATEAGISGQEMLRAMRDASAGTIADSDLMMAANKALMLDVATNAQDMGGLMAAAIERGRALGLSAKQSIGEVIEGIGRMSPEKLDNLGITGVTAQMDAYAATLGKTSAQLSDVQKKHALVNAVLASATGVTVADDAAAAFERMDASLQNAKEALGVMFSPAISAIADKLAEAVNATTTEVQKFAKDADYAALGGLSQALQMGIAELQHWQDAVAVAQFGPDPVSLATAVAGLGDVAARLRAVGEEYNATATKTGARLLDLDALQTGVFAFQELKGAIVDTGIAATGTDPQMLKLANDLGLIGQMALSTTTDLAGMRAEVARLQGVANAVGGARSAGISQAQALAMRAIKAGANPEDVIPMVNAAAHAIDGLTLASGESAGAALQNQLAIEGQLNPLDKLATGLEDANSAAKRFASGGLSDMEQRFDNLKSKVQGVIDGAMDLGVTWPGMNGQDAGGDAINENAKRLAAIANEGLIGQSWMEEFRNEAPGTYADLMLKIAAGMNPQAAAQKLMSEFQAGMRPELLDKEMIKDRVRQMLLGDANASALAQEIASELASEMNVSMPDALSAAKSALGVSPSEGAGVGAGPDATAQGNSAGGTFQVGFIAGFASNDVALKILAGIDKGFKDNPDAIKASGKAVGAAWGTNFMTTVGANIPPALVAMLTTLVTDGVWTEIQAKQGLTAPTP